MKRSVLWPRALFWHKSRRPIFSPKLRALTNWSSTSTRLPTFSSLFLDIETTWNRIQTSLNENLLWKTLRLSTRPSTQSMNWFVKSRIIDKSWGPNSTGAVTSDCSPERCWLRHFCKSDSKLAALATVFLPPRMSDALTFGGCTWTQPLEHSHSRMWLHCPPCHSIQLLWWHVPWLWFLKEHETETEWQSDKATKRTVDDTAFAKSSSKKSTSKTYGMIDHEIELVVKGMSKNRNAK